MNKYDNIVIGGGVAGVFATICLESKNTLLIEKRRVLLSKLLVSGSGSCNFTHSGSLEEFYDAYFEAKRFMKHSLWNFDSLSLVTFIHSIGVQTICRSDGKYFPESMKAIDLKRALLAKIASQNKEIRIGTTILSIEKQEDCFVLEVESDLKREQLYCTNLLICTGGKSYPATGSTGDGYLFAKLFGHTITPTFPALASVEAHHGLSSFSGISFSNTSVCLYRHSKKIAEFKGDLLITHKGLSGPVILNHSRYFEKGDLLKVNFACQKQHLFLEDLLENFHKNPTLHINNYLKRYTTPKQLVHHLLSISNIENNPQLATISKASFRKLSESFCEFEVLISKIEGFNSCMATRGGVSLSEVNPKTMESKILKNLFFAGEVLDVDAITGGYNIQSAFSTAFTAAKEANRLK